MVVILFAAAALAAPSLTRVGDARVGSQVSFEFVEDAAGVVLIDGCSPLEYERLEGDRWIPAPARPCERTAPATVVDGKLSVAAPAPTPGTWRVVLAWGAGCVEGRPFVLAACRQLELVRSEPFEVR